METKDEKIGRNDPCPCGDIKPDGTPKKYKKCCLDKDKKKSAEPKKVRPTFSRKNLISGPYKQCPKCLTADSFGVMMMTSGSQNYSRECIKCWYQKGYKLPEQKDYDLRKYAKVVFDDGRIEEQREILKHLTSRLILKDKQIYLDTEPLIEPELDETHIS